MKSALTLSIDKNFSIRILYARRGLNPMESLQNALNAASVKGKKPRTSDGKRLIDRPIDLTIRQLSFVAKDLKMDFEDLLENILEGVDGDSVVTWKQKFMIQAQRNKELKTVIGQRNDELEVAKKRIATLRNVLHEKGIQDPTIQSREGRGNGKDDADNA